MPVTPRTRWIIVGAIVLVALVGFVAVSRTSETDPQTTADVVHIHGLGVDPDDGTLYAATHTGLFRIPEGGTPVRIANRYQSDRLIRHCGSDPLQH